MATAAELLAVLRADSSQFTATMTRAAATTKGLEKSASRFSQVAKAGMVAAGIAAVKATADFIRFETTMTRLQTLAGASAAEVDTLSAAVKNMAADVATGPQDLAEGLYFVYSAGIKGSAAMETLEYSAKGAAIGLGEVEVVADAVTSVLNAYGTANIKAGEATAILREAVEQSKREADEIAGAIGRVLPIASEMGVEFEQVAGAIAAMTRTGLDANEAVTALRGVLVGILDPTDRGEKVLKKFGISVEELQNAIRSGNLVNVLLKLKAAFGENERAMGQVFPNVRALVGVLSLVGDNAASAQAAFKAVAQATEKDLNDAFNTFAQTTEGKLRSAWASIQTGLLDVGGAIAPVVGAVAEFVTALRPLLTIVPELAIAFAVWKFVPVLLTGISNAALATAVSIKTIQGGALAAAGGVETLRNAFVAFRGVISAGVLAALIAIPELMNTFSISLKKVARETGISTKALEGFDEKFSISLTSTSGSLGEFITKLDGVRDNVQNLAQALGPSHAALQELGLSAEESERFLLRMSRGLEDLTQGSIDDLTVKIGDNLDMIDTWASGVGRDFGRSERLGQISADRMIDNLERLGISHEGALQIAGVALDRYGRKITRSGRVVRRFAGLSKAAFNEWKADAITAMADVERKADVLAGNFAADMERMREAAALMNTDMTKLSKMKWVPEEFLAFLVTQGPGAIHDFVNESKEGQREIVADWRAWNRLLNQAAGKLDTVAGKVQRLNGSRIRITVEEHVEQFISRHYGQGDAGKTGHLGGMVTPTGIYHAGGAVKRMHAGGGRLRADETVAILQRGEFVMQRSAVRALGEPLLRMLNEGRVGRGEHKGRGFRLTHPGHGLSPAEAAANAFYLRRREHGPEVKVRVRPDRKRFGRDLGYDALTRGD